MAFSYLDEDDDEDLPEGFEPRSTTKLVFGRAEGWEKHTEDLGDMPSAFHTYARMSMPNA